MYRNGIDETSLEATHHGLWLNLLVGSANHSLENVPVDVLRLPRIEIVEDGQEQVLCVVMHHQDDALKKVGGHTSKGPVSSACFCT